MASKGIKILQPSAKLDRGVRGNRQADDRAEWVKKAGADGEAILKATGN